MRSHWVSLLLLLGVRLLALTQPDTITPGVWEDLRSSRWQVRRDAFEHIAGDRSKLSARRIRRLAGLHHRYDLAA